MKHITKPISIALALIMLLSVFTALPLTAGATTTDVNSISKTSGDFGYEILYNGTAEITGYYGSATELEIPSTLNGYTVTSISYGAEFDDCINLTSIKIPDSVTSIGAFAFSDCRGLESIMIPDSVSEIGWGVFIRCTNLKNIEVDEKNSRYSSLNGNLYNKDKTELIQYAVGKTDSSFAVLDSVSIIGGQAFEYCTNLTSVTIGNSVTSIGDYAFEYCTNLTSVTIGNSVTSIGDCAFEYCTSLTSITIPDSVTSIGYSAFYYCANLTSVTIGNSVTSIGNHAFEYCTSLISITIPDSVTTIGGDAFYYCANLTSVTIGNSVTSIENYAFSGCTSLISITIPDSVTSIGDCAFCGCAGLKEIEVGAGNSAYSSLNGNLYDKDKTELIQYAIGKTDTSFVIPDSVTSIGHRAFYYCENLESIIIPDSVTSMGYEAFACCTNLKKITIGNSVISIYEGVFWKCSSLESIFIPDNVISIESGAFYNCRSLESITIPDSVTSIGAGAFNGTAWYDTQPDGVVYAGKVAYKYKGDCPETVEIKKGTVGIADGAFDGCENLTSITIPDSVTNIGYCAVGYYFDDGDPYRNTDDLTIIGYSGTEAERYANNNEFEFISLGEAPTTEPTEPTTSSETIEPGESTTPTESVTATEPTEDATSTTPTESIPSTEPSESTTPSESVTNEPTTTTEPSEITALAPKLKKSSVSLKAGKTSTITVQNRGNNKVTYRSSHNKVATVKNGKVTALKKGTANITVTVGKTTLTYKVTVTSNPKLNKTKKALKKGKKFTLKITGGVGKAKFTSNNKKVATVNKNGKIIAKKKGTATITVKTNGMKLKCKITVK